MRSQYATNTVRAALDCVCVLTLVECQPFGLRTTLALMMVAVSSNEIISK
jgi:hypothetical protein